MSDALSPTIEPLFDAGALAARVAELGRTVGRELAAEDPLLLALLGGSVIFLADLVRAIETPVRFDFSLSQPTISRHLSVLKEADLVVDQRQGQNVIYRLNNEALSASMQEFFGQFRSCQEVLR